MTLMLADLNGLSARTLGAECTILTLTYLNGLSASAHWVHDIDAQRMEWPERAHSWCKVHDIGAYIFGLSASAHWVHDIDAWRLEWPKLVQNKKAEYSA